MWRREPSVFWGGVLVIAGILFLLGNNGVLRSMTWDYMWPVAIIAVGVWLVIA